MRECGSVTGKEGHNRIKVDIYLLLWYSQCCSGDSDDEIQAAGLTPMAALHPSKLEEVCPVRYRLGNRVACSGVSRWDAWGAQAPPYDLEA